MRNCSFLLRRLKYLALPNPSEENPSREFLRTIRIENMSKNIAVPDDLYNQAAELTARDHVSVDAFVSALLAKRLADREFVESKAKLFNKEEFERSDERNP